jgi:hypothetical protein
MHSCAPGSKFLSLPLCLLDPCPLPCAWSPAPVPVSCRASCISQRPAFSRLPENSGDPAIVRPLQVQETTKADASCAVMAMAENGPSPLRHRVLAACVVVSVGIELDVFVGVDHRPRGKDPLLPKPARHFMSEPVLCSLQAVSGLQKIPECHSH